MRKARGACRAYVVNDRWGWCSILARVFIFYSKKIFFFGVVDICIYQITKKYIFVLFIALFWCLLVTNHEFGHFVIARKVKKNELPIILKIYKRRKYIVYSIENCTDADIAKVRSNAIKYDFLTIFLGISIYTSKICIMTKVIILLLAILNLMNYLIWTKGSDGYVIKEYIKQYGIKKFLLVFLG